MTPLRAHCLVALEGVERPLDVLRLRQNAAMVDERADRDLLRQLHDTAVVIGVKMRDQQVVNALHARRR